MRKLLILLISCLFSFSAQADNLSYGTLDTPIQTLKITGITSATTLSLPTGAYVIGIVVKNTTANAVTGGLKFGTTVGGVDVIATLAVGASALVYSTDAALLKRIFSLTTSQTIYIDAVAAWNGARINIWVLYKTLQ